jgi:hypothetical protein
MTTRAYKNLQVATPTSGAATTLATVPSNHEYVGAINICYAPSSGAGTTEYNLAITTGGAETTENYIAFNSSIDVGDSFKYTVTLDAGKQIEVSSTVGNVAAQFNFQDRDNS